jgi:hypothetical protein
VAGSFLQIYIRINEINQVGAFKELLIDSLQKALTGVEVKLNSGWAVLTELVKKVFVNLDKNVAGRVKVRVIEVSLGLMKIFQGLLWSVDGTVSQYKNEVSECLRVMMKVKPRDQQFRALVNLNFQVMMIVGLMKMEGNVEEVQIPFLGEDNIIRISQALQLDSSRVLYYRQTEITENSSSFLDGYIEDNLNLLAEISPLKYGLNNYLHVLLTTISTIKVYQELYLENLPKFKSIFNSFFLPSLDDALTITENSNPAALQTLSNTLEVFTSEMFKVVEHLDQKPCHQSLYHFLLVNSRSRVDNPHNVLLSLQQGLSLVPGLSSELQLPFRSEPCHQARYRLPGRIYPEIDAAFPRESFGVSGLWFRLDP